MILKTNYNKKVKVLSVLLKISAVIIVFLVFFIFFKETIKAPDKKLISNVNTEWQAPVKLVSEIPFTEEEKKDQQMLETLPIKSIEKGAIRVPILLYHRIGTPKNPNEQPYYVSPENFERQMHWLALNNYRVISLDALVNYLKNGKNPPDEKSVVITFDDGSKGEYTSAYPILKKYHFNATFFLVPTWLDKGSSGSNDYMSWTEAKEISDYGMEIGSHNLTHKSMDIATEPEMEKELSDSKKILEEKLGKTITTFAYPGGGFTNLAMEKVKENGYSAALSVEKRIDHKSDELYHLGRMHIDDDLPYFIARIQGKWDK